jgi:hypothetical protein
MSSNSFLSSVSIVDPLAVAAVEWQDSAQQYDQQLSQLVTGPHQLILNPQLADRHLHHFIEHAPLVAEGQCTVWVDDRDRWVAKLFPQHWSVAQGYHMVTITRPQLIWRRNPDLDRSITYEGPQVYGVYQPPAWDYQYQLVWYLDTRVAPGREQIWAFSCHPMGRTNRGVKDMGTVMPRLVIEFNPDAPAIAVDLDSCYPAYWDMDCACAWSLDPQHTEDLAEPLWLAKFSPAYRKPKDWQWYGTITPQHDVVYNTDLPELCYDLDYVIPWHDLDYEHVWMLDPRCTNDHNADIWAVRVRAVDAVAGQKVMGMITPSTFGQLDVFFISYGEPEADLHWARVLERAPHAVRIDGVEGIWAAHCRAAELAATDMFWVVDADAWLLDDWHFDYQPSIWLRNCAHVWHSRNALNDLEYGYGGVKLLPRQPLLDSWLWSGLDMTTEVFANLKVMDQVSNESRFNTDPFSAWRSAFRECVKLAIRLQQNPSDWRTQELLKAWQTRDYRRPYAVEAIMAALAAERWVNDIYGQAHNQLDQLLKINDRTWLMDRYQQQVLPLPGRGS